MELNNLKTIWDRENIDPKLQEVSTRLIEQLESRKYRSKINLITYPEIIGTLVCMMAALYLSINFDSLNSDLLRIVGIVTILLLLILSIVSIMSLKQLSMSNRVNNTYADTLKIFANKKLKFYKLQKINITLGYLLLIVVIILLSKLFGGKDLTTSKYFWIFSFTGGYIFLSYFSSFVSRHYRNKVNQMEELLKDLQP